MGHEILKKTRKVELLLPRGKRFEQGLLQKMKDVPIGKKIAQQEAPKKHNEASSQARLCLIYMLPKTHESV